MVIRKGDPLREFDYIDLLDQGITDAKKHNFAKPIKILNDQLQENRWVLTEKKSIKILDKIKTNSQELKMYINSRNYRGILTGRDKVFVVNKDQKNNLIKEDDSSQEIIKKLIEGKDVKAYQKSVPKKYLIFYKKGNRYR